MVAKLPKLKKRKKKKLAFKTKYQSWDKKHSNSSTKIRKFGNVIRSNYKVDEPHDAISPSKLPIKDNEVLELELLVDKN